jgi:hypothetical protein
VSDVHDREEGFDQVVRESAQVESARYDAWMTRPQGMVRVATRRTLSIAHP